MSIVIGKGVKTKDQPQTSDSQVTEEGLLIYASDQPVVETIPGDCKLFVDMVDKGFSFPGFEKLSTPKLELEKRRSLRQITEANDKDYPVLAMMFTVVLAFFIFGGAYPTVSWLDLSPPITRVGVLVLTVILSLGCLWIFRALYKQVEFRTDLFFYLNAIRERWNESERVERVNEERRQAAKRDPVTEKELMDYLMDVFSSQKDGKTITELKQYKKELEKKRKEVEKRKKGPEKRLSDEVRSVYAEQIESVIQNAEDKLREIQGVQNRIDTFTRDVKNETERWIDEFFPHYEDNQYCAEWIQESLEVLSATDETIKEAEVKLIKAEQQFLDRTKTLSQLITDANRYRVSLAEVRENNYNDLSKLCS